MSTEEEDVDSDAVDSGTRAVFSGEVASEGLLAGIKKIYYPRPFAKVGGGRLVFVDPKTEAVRLIASDFDCMVFEMSVTTTEYGGVSEINFRFSYGGEAPRISGSKIRIMVGIEYVGYASLSSFAVNGLMLEGTGISLWHEIAEHRPIPVFHRQSAWLANVIVEYAEFIATQGKLEGYYWPVKEVQVEGAIENFFVNSIDSSKMSIKAMLDQLAKLLGVTYEIRGSILVFRKRNRAVVTNVFSVEVEPNLDTVVNSLDIHAMDKASDTIRRQATVENAESIMQYGTRKGRVNFPFYVNVNYQEFAKNILNPQPRYTGSFDMIALGHVRFDQYFVPYMQRDVVLTLGNTIEGWESGASLVSHATNNRAIKVVGGSVFNYRGALDKVRLTATGSFSIAFLGYDRTSIRYSFSASVEAFKDFKVCMHVYGIEIIGNATILAMTGETSQQSFREVLPNEITYEVTGRGVLAHCVANNGQSVAELLSENKNNGRLVMDIVTK